jgi:hypothetical protein
MCVGEEFKLPLRLAAERVLGQKSASVGTEIII